MRNLPKVLIFLFLLTALPSSARTDSEQLLVLHNQARLNGYRCGLFAREYASPLSWNVKLAQAATTHAHAMAKANKLSHKLEGSISQRLSHAGYKWAALGENLLTGLSSAKVAHKAWLQSTQHCKNIMNDQFTEMGAAHHEGYWVVIFATPFNRPQRPD